MRQKNKSLTETFGRQLQIFTWIISIVLLLPVLPAFGQSSLPASTAMNSTVKKIISDVRKSNAALADELVHIYENTKRFQDVNVALNEGYIKDPMNICESATDMGEPGFLGSMGIHYFRPDLLGITETEPRINGAGLHTDFRNPSVLIYEPQKDGSLELVAVENLVFQKAWDNAEPENKPVFMGHEYFTMIDNPLTDIDEAHMFEAHYDLHMYLYRENPTGLFSPFNPTVSCENHVSAMKMN